MQSVWNPEQYERYRAERSQPFFDLMALVRPRSGMRVLDLGCGTGELTRLLHDKLRARETLGIDSSASMLAKSDAFGSAPFSRGDRGVGKGLAFAEADIQEYVSDGRYDLIFSNAALQWLPEQEDLLRRLTTFLSPGGQIAVQVPANHDHPSHLVANEVASEPPFRDALGGYIRSSSVLLPEEYSALLERLGYREQHVRLQVYGHHLVAREDVIEWVKGTLLTDYEKRLPADLYDAYLARYRELLLPRLDDSRPYFYPFKRILFWGMR